jgi:plastocyanin
MRTITRKNVMAMLGAVLAAAAAAAMLLVLAGGSGAAAGVVAKKSAGVTIKNFKYHKKTLHVGKGTKVVFKNKDAAAHTATDRGAFNTGVIRHNKSKAVTFKHKGSFSYICTLHPGMKGKVVVG